MRVETYALRKGDVIDWDGSPYVVRSTDCTLTKLCLHMIEGEWAIDVSEVWEDGRRSGIKHTIISPLDHTWQVVRIRGARYTAQQYMELMDYEGKVY